MLMRLLVQLFLHPFMPLSVYRRRMTNATCSTAALVMAWFLVPQVVHSQTREAGEVAWARGQELALVGEADSSLAAYQRALNLARSSRDPGLASAARLGMAQVFDVWRQCADSADVAYREATQLAEPGDFNAVDGYVRWLSRQGRVSEARALHRRAYEGIDVPRAIKRETIGYLLGEAAMQRASGNMSAALSTLTNARDVANRLASGDGAMPITDSVNPYSYWVLHDLAELRLDSNAGAARNASAGAALRAMIEGAGASVDARREQRFPPARLRDRVAEARRACGTGECVVPPPPVKPNCPGGNPAGADEATPGMAAH